MKKWKMMKNNIKRRWLLLECEVREKREGLKHGIRQMRNRVGEIIGDTSGITTIELLLILVVIIALILIFKNQLINLVNTIFEKITSESAGI